MSDLIAIVYDDQQRARDVKNRLLALQRGELVDVEDAVVAVRAANGELTLEQLHDLTSMGAVRGTWWGLLVGLMLGVAAPGIGAAVPLVSTAVGAGTGALAGRLSEEGLRDDFVEECAQRIGPGTSALFVLIRNVAPDKVMAAISPFGGHVLRTSLSEERERSLEEALAAFRTTRPLDVSPVRPRVHDHEQRPTLEIEVPAHA